MNIDVGGRLGRESIFFNQTTHVPATKEIMIQPRFCTLILCTSQQLGPKRFFVICCLCVTNDAQEMALTTWLHLFHRISLGAYTHPSHPFRRSASI
jgi:hypothetical protein